MKTENIKVDYTLLVQIPCSDYTKTNTKTKEKTLDRELKEKCQLKDKGRRKVKSKWYVEGAVEDP